MPIRGGYRVPAICALILACTAVASQAGQLSRGHEILIDNGLQIQALARQRIDGTFSNYMEYFAESNFTSVNLGGAYEDYLNYLGPPDGVRWAKWHAPSDRNFDLMPIELPHADHMINYQYRDEQDITNPVLIQDATEFLASIREKYPNVIGHLNQYGGQHNWDQLRNFVSIAKPDMVMFDTYPFDGNTTHTSPTSWYSHMQKYRLLGLAGHDGTGSQPIPYGLYTQTYVRNGHHVSESEMRLNQFAAWAYGCKFATAFVYNRHAPTIDSVLFTHEPNSTWIGVPTARFDQMAETNRQSRNLGASLVRLLSTDIRFLPGIIGRYGIQRQPPSGVPAWSADADPYITAISATNPGSTNYGARGDVLIGYFRPLAESFDGAEYEDEIYFMIVNGLVDPNGSAAETTQRIRIDFDFGDSGINSLQRLNRDTGQVETVKLFRLTRTGYFLDLELEGGTGDLFKFNTSAPFVPAPGDVNGDGLINDKDLSLLLAHWGSDAAWGGGNFNGDDVVDDADLSRLLGNWTAAGGRAGPGQGQGQGQQVPEPAAMALLLVGLPALTRRSPRPTS